jgi:hypothetical protein
VADHLEQLLCAPDEPGVKDGPGEFDVTEVARAFGHVLSAGLALELSVDGAEEGIVEAAIARLRPRLVHGLGVDDVANAHALDFFGREEAKLDLLDRADRRARMRKNKVRHLDAVKMSKTMVEGKSRGASCDRRIASQERGLGLGVPSVATSRDRGARTKLPEGDGSASKKKQNYGAGDAEIDGEKGRDDGFGRRGSGR